MNYPNLLSNDNNNWSVSKATILLVDDEIAVRSSTARVLERSGFHVLLASHGLEALDILAEHASSPEGLDPVDLVITDIQMPYLRGDRLHQLIRENYPDTGIILLTALADFELAVSCLRSGAGDYILKPFSVADLVVRINQALERRHTLLKTRFYQQRLEQEHQERNGAERLQLRRTIESLRYVLEARTGTPPRNQERLTQVVCRLLDQVAPYNRTLREQLMTVAPIFDIGTVALPESLLNKPGALTSEERSLLAHHIEYGDRILSPILDTDTREIIYCHHERWDGTGYLQGLQGEAIPLGARILSVAEAYDALLSERPYRPAYQHDEALTILRQGAGTQWDPHVVEALLVVDTSLVSTK
ncbi:MAG: response regulator [Armatimonadaceae bacterium]